MKNKEIKKKFLTNLMLNGKKETSEKILLKSLKKLQKNSFKQTKNIIKLALTSSMPIFKLTLIETKMKKKNKIKEIPSFITSNFSRISLAVKFILKIIKKKKSNNFYTKLYEELLLNSQNQGDTVSTKNELQKKILILNKKKRYFRFYKWK